MVTEYWVTLLHINKAEFKAKGLLTHIDFSRIFLMINMKCFREYDGWKSYGFTIQNEMQSMQIQDRGKVIN